MGSHQIVVSEEASAGGDMIPRYAYAGLPPWPYTRAWDEGISWRTVMVTPPEDLPLSIAYVRDKVLRVVNGSVEDSHIDMLIGAATQACEDETGRALMPQTRALILDGFPTSEIVIPSPPLIAIDSFTYIDADEVEQTIAGSPADYLLIPSGIRSKARLRSLYGASWPSVLAHPDVVTIQYQCGYVDGVVPAKLLAGIAAWVAENYEIRKLSVQGTNTSVPAQLQLERFWEKVY